MNRISLKVKLNKKKSLGIKNTLNEWLENLKNVYDGTYSFVDFMSSSSPSQTDDKSVSSSSSSSSVFDEALESTENSLNQVNWSVVVGQNKQRMKLLTHLL